MAFEENTQLLGLLTRIANAFEEQNRLNDVWMIHQKEQQRLEQAHRVSIESIQSTQIDLYRDDLAAKNKDTQAHLKNAIETNQALITFLGERERKMMDTIDKCCERTGIPKVDWWGMDEVTERIGKEEKS